MRQNRYLSRFLPLPAATVGVGVVGEAGEVVAARDMDATHADEVRGEELGVEGVNAEAGEVLAEADEGDEVGAVGEVGGGGFLPAGEAVSEGHGFSGFGYGFARKGGRGFCGYGLPRCGLRPAGEGD